MFQPPKNWYLVYKTPKSPRYLAQDLSFIQYFTTIMQLFLLTLAFSVTQCQDRCLIFANEKPAS